MKIKTPEELATGTDEGKDKFTLYLSVKTMKYIKARADKAGVSVSRVVDEAITYYLAALKDKKSE